MTPPHTFATDLKVLRTMSFIPASMWTLIMMPMVQGVRLQDYVLILCMALKYHQNMLQRYSMY